eukprot:515591-Pyramimonas_sp.AAC.1
MVRGAVPWLRGRARDTFGHPQMEHETAHRHRTEGGSRMRYMRRRTHPWGPFGGLLAASRGSHRDGGGG